MTNTIKTVRRLAILAILTCSIDAGFESGAWTHRSVTVFSLPPFFADTVVSIVLIHTVTGVFTRIRCTVIDICNKSVAVATDESMTLA